MNKKEISFCNQVLLEIVSKASEIVIRGYEGNKKVTTKSASYDLVTEYDRETEVFLIQHLSKAFPSHKFIGEETLSTSKLTNEPTWIIDPIDGTANFVHGFPHSAISIALAVNKKIVIGVVCNPMLDLTFTAIEDQGAFLNGKPIKTSTVAEPSEAIVGYEFSLATNPAIRQRMVQQYESIIKNVQGVRSIGSAQISLCMVAQGAWDAYEVENLYPWDLAAGSLIITEAGGTVMDVNGETFNCETGRIMAAGTKALAEKLIEIIKE